MLEVGLVHQPVRQQARGELVDQQRRVATYHLSGLKETALDPDTGAMTPTHYGYSRPWTWLIMKRPLSITWEDIGPSIRQLTAIGNPVIFWGSIWALPFLAWSWWRKRDWVPGFILMAVLIQYLPWFLASRPQFFFYAAPFTPFLVLGIVYMVRGRPAVSDWHPYRPVAWTVVLAAVGLFVWFWPVLSWGVISDTRWKLILWFPGWR